MADIRKRVEKAQKYVEKGKHQDALHEYLAAFHEDPSNDALVEIIAELYARQNLADKALECYGYLFDKHVENNNGPAAVLMYRKIARIGTPDAVRMLACARFLEKQKPSEARGLYEAAAAQFLARGDGAAALEALRAKAALEPDNAELHVRLGELAERLGKSETAGRALARAGGLLRAPGAPPGSLVRATQLLERAAALLPSDTAVAAELAAAVLEGGDHGRAISLLSRFAAQALPECNVLLARAYSAAGDVDRAEQTLWLVAREPAAQAALLPVLESYLASSNDRGAGGLLRRLRDVMAAAGRDKDFVAIAEGVAQDARAGAQVLEFLVSLFRELKRTPDVAAASARQFDAAMAVADFETAISALSTLASVRLDDPDNPRRLESLQGKIDRQAYASLAGALGISVAQPGAITGAEGLTLAGDEFLPPDLPAFGSEQAAPAAVGGLEDMILQAEMLMQFASKEEAADYLRNILTAFPGAEATRMQNIIDGASRTILVAESTSSEVNWLEPKDLDVTQMTFDLASDGPGEMSSHHAGGVVNVIYADGHIEGIQADEVDPAALQALTTIDGGD